MTVNYKFKTKPYAHQVTALDRSMDRKEYAFFAEMGCVDADTEYLSPTGWRRIADYDGGKVAQFNLDGTAEFVEPINYIKLPCETMLHFTDGDRVDQMLSDEHRMLLLKPNCHECNVAHEVVGGPGPRTILNEQTRWVVATARDVAEDSSGDVSYIWQENSGNPRLSRIRHNAERVPTPDGYKYCFEVPSSYLVLRRNGCVFTTGNSGKTKMLLDTMSNLYLRGEIDFALVIAPKGVYRNWTNKEIPDHFPDDVPHRVIRWVSSPNKKQQEEMRSIRKGFDGLTIFVMNVEAFSTIKGKAAGEWMAKHLGPRGLIGIDESTTIKNHKAKRTKALIKIAAGFKYKRIMTGSPITKEPMDIYAQAAFLGPRTLGYNSFYAFQARYAVTQKRTMGAHSFQQVVGYRNLDELTQKIDTFSYRVLKEDCLDLPEKTFTARYVTLTKEQRQMYDQLRQEGFLMLEEGDMVSTPQIITLMLRLQQVVSGHLMSDDGELITFPSGRIDALKEVAAETTGKIVVFARFRHSIQQIQEALESEYGEGSVVTYFGDTSVEARELAVKNFQDPTVNPRFFVTNKTGAYGITLTEASTMVFYESDFSLEVRLQAQDRVHRIGQKNPVTYVDLIAEGTIDEKIVENLRNKIDMSAKVMGEEAREWLSLKPTTK